MQIKPQSKIALVAPGACFRGAWQFGAAIEIAKSLATIRETQYPFDLALGASSGSVVASLVATLHEREPDDILREWLNFSRAISPHPRQGVFNPLPKALSDAFDQKILDAQALVDSPTQLVFTSSKRRALSVAEAMALGRKVVSAELGPLDSIEKFIEPLYFVKGEGELPRLSRGSWLPMGNAQEMRGGIEATTRIPHVFGPLIYNSDGEMIFDGAFADNAPVELALMMGATDVIVVTDALSGKIFQRPFHSYAAKGIRDLLKLGHLGIPESITGFGPIDIGALEKRYNARIHVIHPSREEPLGGNRFIPIERNLIGWFNHGRQAGRQLRIEKAGSTLYSHKGD